MAHGMETAGPSILPDSRGGLLERLGRPTAALVAALLVAHSALALTMRMSSLVPTAHGVLVLGLGLMWAMRPRLDRVAYVAAYIVGSEVLWRMTGARLPWEFGKYSIVLLLGLAMVRGRLSPTAGPLIYFSLLLPSAILTLDALDLQSARKEISFNLSGHLALMLCAWFFSNLRLAPEQMKTLLLAIIAPVSGICAIAVYATLTTSRIHFTNESNFVTSGGFGPNQVSSVLGLAVVCGFLYLMAGAAKLSVRITLFLATLVFAGQSALTFSRGGLVVAFGAISIALLIVLRDPGARFRFVFVLLLAAAAGKYAILPWLDGFTHGTLSGRFQDISTTGRGDLIVSELELFRKAPVFGIGPGMGAEVRSLASHTEFSRILAEHGTMGVASMAVLLLLCFSNVIRAPSPASQGIAASTCAWACLFMLTAGMRLAAPAFMLGLSFVTLGGEFGVGRELAPR